VSRSKQANADNSSAIADALVARCPGSAASNVKVLVSSKEEQVDEMQIVLGGQGPLFNLYAGAVWFTPVR
jgi:hypothetical protein